jgi:hypothetical protein
MTAMKTLLLFCLTIAMFFICQPFSVGQETKDTVMVVIETTDGNEYIGVILSQDGEIIRLKTETIGEITLQKHLIKSITPLKKSEMKGEEHWFYNPYATTRYFYNPSGYGLPAGEGYYQNTWILMNQVSVGITDNVSIGVGVIPIFLFALGSGEGTTPVWFTPKISIPVKKDKLNMGVGALFLTVLGETEDVGGFGILYGVSTFGPKDKNLTVGLGWGYAMKEGIADRPTVSISYIHRSKPKWAFLTENYFISAGDETALILSGGARYISKKITIDFGGVTFIMLSEKQDVFPVIPWLSIAVPINFKKSKVTSPAIGSQTSDLKLQMPFLHHST